MRPFSCFFVFLLSVFICVHLWFQCLSLSFFMHRGGRGLLALPLLYARRVLPLGRRTMGSRFRTGMRRSIRASWRAASCASCRAVGRSRCRRGTRHRDTSLARRIPFRQEFLPLLDLALLAIQFPNRAMVYHECSP